MVVQAAYRLDVPRPGEHVHRLDNGVEMTLDPVAAHLDYLDREGEAVQLRACDPALSFGDTCR